MDRRLPVNILIVGMFASAAIGLKAQASAEFKIVEEIKFDKEIKDVRFGETEDGKLYPKIVVFEDRVETYDEEGLTNSMSLPQNARCNVSPKAKYIGVAKTFKKGDALQKTPSERIFILYDDKLQEMTRIQYKVSFDGCGDRVFRLSDSDGSFVDIDYGIQVLRFCNISGNLKREIDMFRDDEYSQWGVISKYSKSGEYLAVIGCYIYFDPVGDAQHDFYLILFDKDGTEIWRKLIQKGQTHMSIDDDILSISSYGNYILAAKAFDPACSDRELLLFNKDGDIVSTYRGVFGRFSDDESNLAICGRNKVHLVQTQNGKIVWFKEYPWNIDSRQKEWRWINSVDVSEEGELIGILSESYRRYRNPDGTGGVEKLMTEIILLDGSGEVVCKKEATGEERIAKLCKNELIFIDRNILKRFKISQ